MSLTAVEKKTAVECIERGVEFLDGVRPGWHQEINLETLDIAYGSTCVLGQLYGNFYTQMTKFTAEEGCLEYGDQIEWSNKHGFSMPELLSDALLTPLWRERIRELSLSA